MLTRQVVAAALLLGLPQCHGDGVTAPSGGGDSPADVVMVTSDIGNFWRAVDRGGDAASFDSIYLAHPSQGLADFIKSRNLTGQSLSQMVRAFPRYFASIRANTLSLTANGPLLATIRANFERIEVLYPAATFPPLTFLIGRFSTGGTTSLNGMLIGVEFWCANDDSPRDELGAFQKANVRTASSLPYIIAHEHAHILQQKANRLSSKGSKNLLEQSLIEGSADFIGELVSGGHINGRQSTYGLAHEAELWTEFEGAMRGTDISQWLYNQGNATGERPGDLGYFIGYRIAQAYYAKATDKSRALAEIVEVGDASAFLTASGYNPR